MMRSKFFFTTMNRPNPYDAVIEYATAQSYTLPSAPQRILQRQLVSSLLAHGVWRKLDLLYVFAGDGDEDFACINWVNPGSFTATPVDSPAFTPDVGFQGDGVSAYIETNYTPSADGDKLTQTDAGAFTYIANDGDSASSAALGAVELSGGRIELIPRATASGNLTYGINSGNAGGGANPSTIGFYHWYTSPSHTVRIYKDGSVMNVNGSFSGISLNTISLHLLKRHSGSGVGGGTVPGPWQISVFGIGASMNGKESALYSAWNTYFTSL